jgi:hypothetical protein
MKIIKYKQTEWLMPWKWPKKNPLYRFILDIPYALYFSVVPSREALNEVLRVGQAGGGMGEGLVWQPFEITPDEYEAVLNAWREFDLRKVIGAKKSEIPDLAFIFDDEIMAIPHHLDYVRRSSAKYESHFFKKA